MNAFYPELPANKFNTRKNLIYKLQKEAEAIPPLCRTPRLA